MDPHAPGSNIGPPSRSKLVAASGTKHTFTTVRTTDSRTAVCRGLAEYLSSIVVNAPGGRQHRFNHVYQTYAEPDDNAQYPSAWVYTESPAMFDASRFTPGIASKDRTSDGQYLMQTADLVADLTVEMWCTDPKERSELTHGMEIALNPVDWMYGFILELPHYYNQRAVYSLLSMQFVDGEEDAMRRYRLAQFVVNAQLPVIQLRRYPDMKPRVRLDAIGPDVIVETQ